LYIAEVTVLFDNVIESEKIGLRKPDPRIYKMMTDVLGSIHKTAFISTTSVLTSTRHAGWE
jgi:FMN phosphatase YigB (HAD superfamily)